MSPYRRSWRGLAGAVALALAACSDSPTGPVKPADPLATAAHVAALNQSFSSPAFESFALVAPPSAPAASSFAALRALLRSAGPAASGRLTSVAESRLLVAALRSTLAPVTGVVSAVIFPPELLGKTFEWDTTSVQYQVTDRAGAPANGVRFILYALDLGGSPIVTQEIGYADLKDESSGTTQQMHLLVVGATVTYLDYTVAATAGPTAGTGTVTVLGYITDGSHRLDFNCPVTVTATSVTLDIAFDVNADNAHVRETLTVTPIQPSGLGLDIAFTLQVGNEVVTLTGADTTTGVSESGRLTVRVNGGLYATITITNGEPTFLGAAGQPLTADDLTALNALFNAIWDALGHFDDLITPTGLGG